MKKNDTSQPEVNKADSSTREGLSNNEQSALDASLIENRVMKDGTWELLLGFWIILATITMYSAVNHLSYEATLRTSFDFIVLFTYFFPYYIQKRNLRKEFPNVEKKTIINTLDAAPLVYAVVPWFLSLVMVYLQLDKLSIVLPQPVVYIVSMLLVTGLFSGILFNWYHRVRTLRTLIWALLTLAIVVLLGFDVINLSNFYMFYMPLGIVIFLTGLFTKIGKKASV